MAERQKRKWQPREQRMLSEYMAEFFPEVRYQVRVRLGSPQPRAQGRFSTEEVKMLGVWRRWADALAYLPTNELLLIEAKIRPEPGVISQIKLYERLISHTPELLPYTAWPIRKRIVYAIPDAATFMLAREDNIEVVHYEPKWLGEYLNVLQKRESQPHKF